MYISQFLAKYFGFYFLLISIAIALRPSQFKTVMASFAESPALVMISGVFTLLFGLFLVMIHTLLVPDWRLLVTVLCWVTLIKGWCLLVYPKAGLAMGKRMSAKKGHLLYAVVGYILLGLVLLYFGCYTGMRG